MKPYGSLKNGDVVYTLQFDKNNNGHIFHYSIGNLQEYNEHKVYFEVYNTSIDAIQPLIMEKNRRWGVYSPSIDGLYMYWKREMKRIFRRYKNSHNE